MRYSANRKDIEDNKINKENNITRDK